MSSHIDPASTTEVTESPDASIGSTSHVLTPIQEQDDSDSASAISKEDTRDSIKEGAQDVVEDGIQDPVEKDVQDAVDEDPHDAAKQDVQDTAEKEVQNPIKQDIQGPVTHDIVVSYQVHSDATFQVLVADVLTKFKVSAHLIATASPVWRVIIYGPDTTVPPTSGEWVVDIDAKPQALDTLFRIVHYQFHKVPTVLSLEELYELTLVTSRFKCVHLIYPWAQKWATQFSTYACEDGHFDHCHKVAWIAWEIGDEALFRDMVHAMIVSSKVNDQGDLVNTSGILLKEMILPPGVLDLIIATRISTMEKIFAAANAPMMALTFGNREPGTKYCKLGQDEKQCEAMLLGSAIQELSKAHLYPVPSATSFPKSIVELKDTFRSMKFVAFVGSDRLPHKTHDHCNLGFRQSAERFVEEMTVPLEEHHLGHLKAQARLSGINADLHVHENQVRTFKTGKTVFKDTWIDSSKKIARRQANLAQGKEAGDESDGEFDW